MDGRAGGQGVARFRGPQRPLLGGRWAGLPPRGRAGRAGPPAPRGCGAGAAHARPPSPPPSSRVPAPLPTRSRGGMSSFPPSWAAAAASARVGAWLALLPAPRLPFRGERTLTQPAAARRGDALPGVAGEARCGSGAGWPRGPSTAVQRPELPQLASGGVGVGFVGSPRRLLVRLNPSRETNFICVATHSVPYSRPGRVVLLSVVQH